MTRDFDSPECYMGKHQECVDQQCPCNCHWFDSDDDEAEMEAAIGRVADYEDAVYDRERDKGI